MDNRKLKNRVAAQCARDRKKAQMDNLEDELTRMKNAVRYITNDEFVKSHVCQMYTN